MGFPGIEPSEVANCGLIWLFLTYGYVLYFSSGLISEGSDLLLLVPAYAGIVGSCVLPVLGAVPDGAIMLFSGMGPDLDAVQDQLAVGVGALAGSTIMLLTIPWAMALIAGRVDIEDGVTVGYTKRPKLSPTTKGLFNSGVCAPGNQVQIGVQIMLLTCISYGVIQVPALVLAARGMDVAEGEKTWSLVGLFTTLIGFVGYLVYQLNSATAAEVKTIRADEFIKQKLKDGSFSLGGVMLELLKRDAASVPSAQPDWVSPCASASTCGYRSTDTAAEIAAAHSRLANIVKPFFQQYDRDHSGHLDKSEMCAIFKDLGEDVSQDSMDSTFAKLDADDSGEIDFEEFVCGIKTHLETLTERAKCDLEQAALVVPSDVEFAAAVEEGDEEEEEEVPADIASLTPARQQSIIKRRALFKLVAGTFLVLLFSDPMVDVMAEIGVRTGIPAFYVSFILAPLASNASELMASYYYALKKTPKSIAISFAALEGAACMNNTFCLSIFMGLIYFRGIKWQYAAETLSILVVQLLVACIARKRVQTLFDAAMLLAIYPASIALVAILEAMGYD